MRGTAVLLKLGNSVVALQTECHIEVQVGVSEIVPLPGSESDDGWAHYKTTYKQWAVSNGGFLVVGDELLEGAVLSRAAKLNVEISLSDGVSLVGRGIISQMQIDAQTRGNARATVALTGDGWPSLIINNSTNED